MFNKEIDWLPKQDRLRSLIKKNECFDEAIQIALEMHALLHSSEVTKASSPTLGDEIWQDLNEEDFTIMPTKKDVTIAWNIWHVTRIEDLISNLLIHSSPQVLDEKWQRKLKTSVRDTGNAMSDEEIIQFSKEVDKIELHNYRNAVGKQTQKVLKSLTPERLNEKPYEEDLDKIVNQGGLTFQEQSIWLRDFWGKKTIAGLILLPITRHQLMHLPNCLKLKSKIKKSRS